LHKHYKSLSKYLWKFYQVLNREINICEIVMIDKRIKNGKEYRNKFIKELKICLNLFLLQFRPKKKYWTSLSFSLNFLSGLKLWLWVWKLQNSRKLLKKHYKQINGIVKNKIIFGYSDQANKKGSILNTYNQWILIA